MKLNNDPMLRTGLVIAARYQVVKHLGSGGMADVYKVWDRARAVHLAMKLLKPAYAESEDFITIFKQEAQHLRDLSHPNIVRFYEFGWDRSNAFFVMEYVEGKTLRQELDTWEGSLPTARIQVILRSICPALYYAHTRNVIHCDLKPANILIDGSGKPYVSDFGIAQVAHKADALQHLENLTGAGTPVYMAPEQMTEDQPRLAADLYSLGVILYEMLTGQKPFTGKYAPASITSDRKRIIWEKMHYSPRFPSEANSSVPASFDPIVNKCLDQNPDRRYGNALEVLNDLENALILNDSKLIDGNNIKRLDSHQKFSDFIDRQLIDAPIKKTARPSFHKLRFLLVLGLASLALIAGLFFLTNGNLPFRGIVTSKPQHTSGMGERSFNYTSICMPITISNQPRTFLEECVESITVMPDGTLKVYMSWTVTGITSTHGVMIGDDSENSNMYLTDNLNNRLDHIDTGDGTNTTVSLYNGQSKTGWFLFPAPDSGSTYYYFHDGDNGKTTPRIERRW